MALTEEDPAAAPAEQETAVAERAPVTGHIAMVDRVPLVPWGSTSSGPSLPSADDEEVPDVSSCNDGLEPCNLANTEVYRRMRQIWTATALGESFKPGTQKAIQPKSQRKTHALCLPRSSTMSVRSSLYNYVQENGRTYHRYKEGSKSCPRR